MRVRLEQGPEGSPNFCFGLYCVSSRCPDCGHKWERHDHSLGCNVKDRSSLCGCGEQECAVFVQSDWDYAGLASSLGWVPCECGHTDGTVNCEHKTATQMLSEAFDYLAARVGQRFNYDAA